MSAEDPTPTELLTAVNAAIYALVTKRLSNFTVDGVTYYRQDLAKLRQMRSELMIEVRPASGSVRLGDFR